MVGVTRDSVRRLELPRAEAIVEHDRIRESDCGTDANRVLEREVRQRGSRVGGVREVDRRAIVEHDTLGCGARHFGVVRVRSRQTHHRGVDEGRLGCRKSDLTVTICLVHLGHRVFALRCDEHALECLALCVVVGERHLGGRRQRSILRRHRDVLFIGDHDLRQAVVLVCRAVHRDFVTHLDSHGNALDEDEDSIGCCVALRIDRTAGALSLKIEAAEPTLGEGRRHDARGRDHVARVRRLRTGALDLRDRDVYARADRAGLVTALGFVVLADRERSAALRRDLLGQGEVVPVAVGVGTVGPHIRADVRVARGSLRRFALERVRRTIAERIQDSLDPGDIAHRRSDLLGSVDEEERALRAARIDASASVEIHVRERRTGVGIAVHRDEVVTTGRNLSGERRDAVRGRGAARRTILQRHSVENDRGIGRVVEFHELVVVHRTGASATQVGLIDHHPGARVLCSSSGHRGERSARQTQQRCSGTDRAFSRGRHRHRCFSSESQLTRDGASVRPTSGPGATPSSH